MYYDSRNYRRRGGGMSSLLRELLRNKAGLLKWNTQDVKKLPAHSMTKVDCLSLHNFIYPYLIKLLPQEIVDIIYNYIGNFVHLLDILTVEKLTEFNDIYPLRYYHNMNFSPQQIMIREPNCCLFIGGGSPDIYIIPSASFEKEIREALYTVEVHNLTKLYHLGDYIFKVRDHNYSNLKNIYNFIIDKPYFQELNVSSFLEFCLMVEEKYLYNSRTSYYRWKLKKIVEI